MSRLKIKRVKEVSGVYHVSYLLPLVLWWGVWLICCSVRGGWRMAYAPAFITFLLRKFSGVPLLEKKYAENPEWQKYCKKVPIFVPFLKP